MRSSKRSGRRRREELAHPVGLELEHAGRRCPSGGAGRCPGRRAAASRGRASARSSSSMFLTAHLEDRQRPQPEEVHLEEADVLEDVHRPLRDDVVAERQSGTCSVSGTSVITTPAACVDMLRAMPSSLSAMSNSRRFGVARRVQPLELRVLLERVRERGVRPVRDLLRDPVDLGERHVEHAADVADDGARRHRAERDDLRDAVGAVLVRDVRR